jgi:nucleoside-diphosphate-sugar epimerase
LSVQSNQHFLIIGAGGFIGAWMCRKLVEAGARVTAVDANPAPQNIKMLLSAEQIQEMNQVTGDVRDADFVKALFDESVTHVVYLAGILRPKSEEDPALSAQVSIVGLINVFEAIKASGRSIGISYASTSAIYGSNVDYPNDEITAETVPVPELHYGLHRVAMEMTAKIYFLQHGMTSVGLRPWIVYGPGRFHGVSAEPSLAMLAAAAGQAYQMNFGGSHTYHHVDDVSTAFIESAQASVASAVVANIPGNHATVAEIAGIIEEVVPSAKGKITFSSKALGSKRIVRDATYQETVGPLDADLHQRVGETIADYRELLDAGRITLP